MFLEQSKQEEKIVQDVAQLVKKYTPNLAEVYYIPRELNSPHAEIITKTLDSDNQSQYFHYPLLDEYANNYDEMHGILAAIDLSITNQSLLTPELTAMITELEEANGETSIIKLRQKTECQQMIDEIGDTLNHVLDTIGDKAARSNKDGFYVTDKLDTIEEIITSSDSPYHIMHKSPHCIIYGKEMPKRESHPILVSSHSDIVNAIQNPSSTLADGFYHGTYDNMGTNAAITTLMLMDNNMPDNVYFAFTDEEESGRCYGATECAKWLKGFSGNNPFCIALDVTDEGYYDNCLCSVEGLSAKEKIKKAVKDAMFKTEPDIHTFCVSKADFKDESPFPMEYISAQYTVFDESAHYAELKQNTLSFCLPTTGNMHGDSGLDVKESVFIGYCLSLEAFIHGYCNDNIPFDQYQIAKEMLVEKAKETKRIRPSYSYPTYPYLSEGAKVVEDEDDYDYDDDEEEPLISASLGTVMDFFGYQDPDEVDSEDLVYTLEMDLREMASCYTPGDLEVFLQDIEYNYGPGMISEKVARQIFMEEHTDYDEDYDEEGYEDYS